jgi:Rap1a immunity proteins
MSQVRAQSQDGSFYLQACSAAVKQSDGKSLSTEEEPTAIFCIGYISGFLDAHSLTTTQSGAKKFICTPERGISNDQAIRIFVKYLRENPKILHESGRISLYVSLATAFPCAK